MKIKATAIAAMMLVGIASQTSFGEQGYALQVAPHGTDVRVAVPHAECIGEFTVASETDADTLVLDSDPGTLAAGLYFIRFVDGPLAGKWYTISSSSGTTINLVNGVNSNTSAADVSAISPGAKLLICQHWTITRIFPDNLAGLLMAGDTDVTDGVDQKVQVLVQENTGAGLNAPPTKTLFYVDDPDNGFEGWFDLQASPQNNFVVAPQQTFVVRNLQAATTGADDVPNNVINENSGDLLFVSLGDAPKVKVVDTIPIQTSAFDYTLQMTNVLPVKLSETGLATSGALAAITDVTVPNPLFSADQLLVFDNSTSAGFNTPPAKTYVYVNDPANGFVGWFDLTANDSDDVELEAGQVFVLRKKGGAAGSTVDYEFDPNSPAP